MSSTVMHEPIHLGPITVTFSVEAEESNGTVTVQRCDVGSGAGVPFAHSHDGFEETIYGLEGTVTFIVDSEQIHIGPGDTFCIRRGAVHSFMANDGDVSFLAIATPGVFGPEYFRDVAAAIESDPSSLPDVMRRHGLTPAL